jgi:hypothetical protein
MKVGGRFLLFIGASGFGLAYAASCTNLQPIQGELGYRERSGPERCEGLYRSLVAGEIELLSFVSSPMSFDPQKDDAVAISVPKIAMLGDLQISIVARALPLRVYYRMDALAKGGEVITWPISAVVAPAGLESADLGLVGSTLTSGGRVFLPISVSAAGSSTDLYPQPLITFRAPMDLDQFLWKIEGADPSSWKRAPSYGTIRSGDPITFAIDGPRARPVTLEVAAKPTEGDWIRTRTMLLIP